VTPNLDTEWAMRLYNQDNPTRHSRLSFYMFNLRHDDQSDEQGRRLLHGVWRLE
jgi:hypothetical protein